MLPEDIQDLILAILLLVIIVVVGSLFPGFGISLLTYQGVDLHDEGDILLLNYVRTETGSGHISDLIAFAEYDSEKFSQLQAATRQIFDFYIGGRDLRDYIVKVKYPEQDYKTVYFKSGREDALIDIYGKDSMVNEWKYEIKIPSVNKGIIEIEMEIKDE